MFQPRRFWEVLVTTPWHCNRKPNTKLHDIGSKLQRFADLFCIRARGWSSYDKTLQTYTAYRDMLLTWMKFPAWSWPLALKFLKHADVIGTYEYNATQDGRWLEVATAQKTPRKLKENQPASVTLVCSRHDMITGSNDNITRCYQRFADIAHVPMAEYIPWFQFCRGGECIFGGNCCLAGADSVELGRGFGLPPPKKYICPQNVA